MESCENELRQDIVTGKWVIIAPGRGKEPERPADKTGKYGAQKYVETCPFCNLVKYPQAPDSLRLPDDADNWEVHIFENKYPAMSDDCDLKSWQLGPHHALSAYGYHDLLTPKGHDQEEVNVDVSELARWLEALQLRWRQLKAHEDVAYIQIFRNHGDQAGASQPHPHIQIITLPIIPSDVSDMLHGSERYAKRNGVSAFSDMLDLEKEAGERIVWENDDFVVFCPYASRSTYETWVCPKKDQPYFDTMSPAERRSCAEALQQALRRLHIVIDTPAFNYYIHSAMSHEFENFRWHIEILPRFGNWAGLELATALEINTTSPEVVAKELRDINI